MKLLKIALVRSDAVNEVGFGSFESLTFGLPIGALDLLIAQLFNFLKGVQSR